MKNKDSSYYVPEQSAWPIIGALALLFLAFGSLNLDKQWGLIAFIIGIAGLVFMLSGWLWHVTEESNAGLYNQQMNKTFRWGMLWFLISELFLTPWGRLHGVFHLATICSHTTQPSSSCFQTLNFGRPDIH